MTHGSSFILRTQNTSKPSWSLEMGGACDSRCGPEDAGGQAMCAALPPDTCL